MQQHKEEEDPEQQNLSDESEISEERTDDASTTTAGDTSRQSSLQSQSTTLGETSRQSSLEKRVLFDTQVIILEHTDVDETGEEGDGDQSDDGFEPSPETEHSTNLENSLTALAPLRNASKHSRLSGGLSPDSKSTYGLVQRSDSRVYNFGYKDSRSQAFGRPISERGADSDIEFDEEKPRIPRWCWWVCIFLFFLIIAVVISVVITWIVVMPRKPHLQLVRTSVEPLSTPVKLSESFAEAAAFTSIPRIVFPVNFTFHFLFRNPNRVSTKYSSTSVEVVFLGDTMGSVVLPSFRAGPKQFMERNVTWTSLNESLISLLQPSTSILPNLLVPANVSLTIKGKVDARLRILGLPSPPVWVRLSCGLLITNRTNVELDADCAG